MSPLLVLTVISSQGSILQDGSSEIGAENTQQPMLPIELILAIAKQSRVTQHLARHVTILHLVFRHNLTVGYSGLREDRGCVDDLVDKIALWSVRKCFWSICSEPMVSMMGSLALSTSLGKH